MTPAGEIDRALSAPPLEAGPRLLALPESQWYDRKSFRIQPRKLAESIVAFANADGGTIAIGLANGVVEGVDSEAKHLNELMQTAVKFTEPTVATTARLLECEATIPEASRSAASTNRENGAADHVLIIEVASGGTVHATTKDDVFLRIGDENHRLNFAQRRELLFDKNQSTYEAEPTRASVAENVDHELLAGYQEAVSAPDRARLLAARGLATDGTFTIAGLLLFGQHPERELPAAQVRVCRFTGTERQTGSRQNLRDDRRVEGPIPQLLQLVRDVVRSWQPTRRALAASGKFEDVGLVPEDAWLEAIVNAVVHRSYSIYGDHIHVDIYDDKIIVESPGRFPGLVDLANPTDMTRFARNPRIARVCTDLRITQGLGEGIRRMFDEMRAAGLADPIYQQTAGSVRLTLSGEPTHQRLANALPTVQQRILAVLREVDAMGTGEIADALGSARPTVLRHLAELRDGGYVEWVGKSPKDPRASWTLR